MTTLRRGATLLEVAVALLALVALGAASPRPAVVDALVRACRHAARTVADS